MSPPRATGKAAVSRVSVQEIAGQIREYRKRQGLTLQDVSAMSGLSVSTLSKIENGKTRLTLDTALLLAGALKVPVTGFLAEEVVRPTARRSITRAGQGTTHSVNGMAFEVLCADFKEKRNFFWRVTVAARTVEASGGWRRHPGEEFLHVMSGVLELHTEHYETMRLGPGDSILFDATMPHAYVAAGDGDTVLLMSNTIPQDASSSG